MLGFMALLSYSVSTPHCVCHKGTSDLMRSYYWLCLSVGEIHQVRVDLDEAYIEGCEQSGVGR
jgi:hypothetical protein